MKKRPFNKVRISGNTLLIDGCNMKQGECVDIAIAPDGKIKVGKAYELKYDGKKYIPVREVDPRNLYWNDSGVGE